MRTEAAIVAGLRAGQADALEELYRLYADRIWRFLVRLTGDQALAEDLFQETWLAATRRAHLLREDSALLRWLYTIARNLHRVAWRNGLAERTKCARYQQEQPTSASAATEAQLELDAAQAALRRLPDAYREVLVLCGLEGLEATEAAAVLGISPEAVRKRLSRARAELSGELERHHGTRGRMS